MFMQTEVIQAEQSVPLEQRKVTQTLIKQELVVQGLRPLDLSTSWRAGSVGAAMKTTMGVNDAVLKTLIA